MVISKDRKVKDIVNILEKLYPKTPIPLKHKDPFTLLVSVVLSAQCTDERVNQITPILFNNADTPLKMSRLPVTKIEKIIRPCGLSPQKSKAISGLSKLIVNKHNSKVPQHFKDLEDLPGVGHKTASVVMSQAFGYPAFPVDTHIHRLAWEMGLVYWKKCRKNGKRFKKTFSRK